MLGFIERISFTHKFHLHPFLIAPHALWQSQSFFLLHKQQMHLHVHGSFVSAHRSSPTFAGASLFPLFPDFKVLSPHIPPLVVVSFHVSFPYQMIISKVRTKSGLVFITQSLQNRFSIIICWIWTNVFLSSSSKPPLTPVQANWVTTQNLNTLCSIQDWPYTFPFSALSLPSIQNYVPTHIYI